jgi:predicted HicB family RNase H-like nuclease
MKTFPLKINDEMHKSIRHCAIEKAISVHQWILDAIEKKLKEEDIKIKNQNKS